MSPSTYCLALCATVLCLLAGTPMRFKRGRPLDYPQPHLGKVQIPSIRSLPVTTAVIIMQGQSLIANRAEGTYTTKNRDNALNFNIYDGELYQCSNPVLGTDLDVSHPSNTNSSTCQIADLLINAGTFRTVIMVPTAVGGTLCSDWTLGGALYQRIVVRGLRDGHNRQPGYPARTPRRYACSSSGSDRGT